MKCRPSSYGSRLEQHDLLSRRSFGAAAPSVWNSLLLDLLVTRRCPISIRQTSEVIYLRQRRRLTCFVHVCLSVCLSVSKIIQKRVHGFV